MPKLNLQEIRFGSVVPTGDRITPDHAEKTLFPFICEAITLPAYDEIPYVFDLEEREYLEFTLRSDIPVDVLLCNASDYDRWVDSGYDPEIAFRSTLKRKSPGLHPSVHCAPPRRIRRAPDELDRMPGRSGDRNSGLFGARAAIAAIRRNHICYPVSILHRGKRK